jgi:hypothetical protein
LARQRIRILRGKRVFLSLSFLGVVALGFILLGFWYLVEPRLAQIYSELPVIVGLILIATYLAVVALFSLIVASTYFQKDFISAKKITVRSGLSCAYPETRSGVRSSRSIIPW